MDEIQLRLYGAKIEGRFELQVHQELNQEDFDVHARNSQGETFLHWMSSGKFGSASYLPIIRRLVENFGAEVDARDNGGRTPLYCAAFSNNFDGLLEIIRYLIQSGADVNAQDNRFGESPLHKASQRGHLEVVQLLCQYGANLECLDNHQTTPLYAACGHGDVNVVRFLLNQGASWAVETSFGHTPLHVACATGGLDVVELLFNEGATVADVTTRGLTPLHSACEGWELQVVIFLLNRGADATAQTIQGETPLQLACMRRPNHVHETDDQLDFLFWLVRLYPELVTNL